MNRYLRTPDRFDEEMAADMQRECDWLSEALHWLPPTPGITYRGLRLSKNMRERYKPGRIITEAGFTSTSQDESVARRFRNDRSGRHVVMEITSPYSEETHEKEILYDKGTRFLVESKTEQAGGWRIVLREVPATTARRPGEPQLEQAAPSTADAPT